MKRRNATRRRRLTALIARAGQAPSRRGTILIVVLGALALLSVITVAYVSVGKSDRRTAMVVRRDADVNKVVDRVMDYIATDIIAADLFSVYKQTPKDTFIDGGYVREAWDYPYTGWLAKSDDFPPLNDNEYPFSPVGTFPADLYPLDDADLLGLPAFPGSDPWLADTLPTNLNYNIDFPSDPAYLDIMDWGHISNIAPDGRFANLFALRNNFDVRSGGMSGEVRLGHGLTLFQPNGVPYTTDVDMDVYPNTQSDLYFAGDPAQLDTPAHWDSDQRHMFRPARDAVNGPDSPLYLHYQYADTDGDGYFDARWQELVDSSNPDGPMSLLPQDGQYRWVVAARIVDLSSMVNVNTATNISRGSSSPDEKYPIGLSPADVDLVRLLSGVDNYNEYGDAYFSEYVLPEKFDDPYYIFPRNYVDQVDRQFESNVARRAYSYIYRTITDNEVPGPNVIVPNVDLSPKQRLTQYNTRSAFFGDAGLSQQPLFNSEAWGIGGLFNVDDQIELMTRHGLNDDTQVSRLERAVGARHTDPANIWYSPLRENWPTTLELGFHDMFRGANFDVEGDGRIDANAQLKLAADVRRLLTVVNGGRRLQSDRIWYPDANDNNGNPYPVYVARSMVRLDWGTEDTPLDAFGALVLASGLDGSQPDPGPLFEAYVHSLMPHMDEIADLDGFDAWEDPTTSPYATTAYAHDPLRAYLTAAHMTANAIDMFDDDNEISGSNDLLDLTQQQHVGTRGPSAFTLVLANDFQDNSLGYQWEKIEIDRDLLPDKNDLPDFEQGAVNVYGVEVQPFITEVGSMLVFTDQHVGDGGDDEWDDYDCNPPPGGIGGGAEAPPEITINTMIPGRSIGGIDDGGNSDNGDFVVQLLVFQLTNPFGEDVVLFDPDHPDDYFYVEYGGEYYKLEDVNDGLGDVGDLDPRTVLEPGQTRNFVALSETREDVQARFTDVRAGSLTIWLGDQFDLTEEDGSSSDYVLIHPVDPSTGSLNPPELPHNFFSSTASPEDLKEVRLWRTKRRTAAPTMFQTDILADRLRHPNMEDALNREDGWGDGDVQSTFAGPDPTQTPGNGCSTEDNTGYTMVLWGSVKRPDNPGTLDVPQGAIPAWCLERRDGVGATLNRESLNSKTFSKGAFNGDGGFETINDFVNANDIIETIATVPSNKKDVINHPDYPASVSIDSIYMSDLQLPYERIYPQININNNLWLADPDNSVQTTKTLTNDEFKRLRLGDMLLPLAIGPTYDPSGATHRGDGWVTLSEKLCSSLGYDGAAIGGGVGADRDVFADLWQHTDRANIRLDAYVPFVDSDLNGTYDFDPWPGETVRGTGNPVAVDILDAFATIESPFGSIVKPVYGKININTAPLQVLRTLPQLSPPVGSDVLTGQNYWWWDPSNTTAHNERSDIAANIYAYRDKRVAWPRGVVPTLDNALNFDELGSDVGGSDAFDPDDASNTVDPTNALSRQARTNIPGVRETPGFASVGEILNVRDTLYRGGIGGGGNQYPAPHDMDRLGVADDGVIVFPVNVEEEGLESSYYAREDDGIRNDTDEIESEFDQKLMIANGLFNTIDVRSDVYAVWFVIHGYQRSDVEGLRNDEPMVPSVARRYLMIVDRSNVTDLGDKPKILAIKQLPL